MRNVALITGGSRGIGLGIATSLANTGFDVVINGMRPASSVSDVIGILENLGAQVLYCQGNIAIAGDRKKMVDDVIKKFSRINVLVNNAGIAPRERNDILKATEESFDEVVGTNLKGTYFLTQLVANHMIERQQASASFRSCIINVSSMSATVASTNRGEYCISKAGLSMATQLFAVRLGEFNIPVYEVRPGIIATDMTSGVKEKYDKLIENGLTVQKRWGYPEDVGKVVAALATGSFPYSTGQVVMVDGGLTIPRL
jgi:3-oxoacyl-[acyl-carrier protein] reductase